MNVKIVSISKPEGELLNELNNAGDLIAYTARVSNPSNQLNTETAPKLIKYLADHKHWSPFEMCSVVMEIETTRDIAHQILRHRSFAFQEFSQRYATTSNYVTNREARLQDAKNRQNSIEVDNLELQKEWEYQQQSTLHFAKKAYQWALDNGIAKECARVVLPEGLTMTKIYIAGTVRSWIHYCQVRTDKGVQKEHREIALECWRILTDYFPDVKGLIDYEWSEINNG